MKEKSRVDRLNSSFYDSHNVQVFIKREDLIHDRISGNKWRKLKYNIKIAQDHCYKGILTFGGAYSNHLHATAFATHEAKLRLHCIVRALDTDLSNPTMHDVREWGGEIQLVDRETYKLKSDPNYVDAIQQQFPDYFIIPEGGNNFEAQIGLAEMASEIRDGFDYIFISVGTGASAIGLISNLSSKNTEIKAVSAVNDFSLKSQFKHKLKAFDNWELLFDYTRGGFGKTDPELVSFINSFYDKHQILLDPIYNGKTMMGLHQMIEAQRIKPDSKILFIHTGGIQGIKGHNLKYHSRKDMIINR